MTNNELKELLARAIANDNGRRDPDPIDKCNAQAVIEALTPMMSGVVASLEMAEDEYAYHKGLLKGYVTKHGSPYSKALASLPDCWKGE
jgi:hypothetical protein